MRLKQVVGICAASASTLLLSSPALAGTYQALCGGAKCTVHVSATEIRSPFGTIPATRVTNWGGGGDSNTSVGTGVATTVLFGPLGLLGFLAKNHDFNFLVNGYDASGKKTSISVQFKNDKPARRFVDEMAQVTGIGMGQTRSASDIKKLEAEQSLNDLDSAAGGGFTLNEAASLEEAASKEEQLAGETSTPSGNCWSGYLDENPNMKAWAEANPAMAEDTKSKFDDC